MSKICISLPESQYLSDIEINIQPQHRTLLESSTGTGKTHFTMEKLNEQFSQVVMLVPTQAKVMELENSYHQREGYQFFYAEQRPTADNVLTQGVIVLTYDKFLDIRKFISQDCLLVIDECHKLISSGSFRDAALNPIITDLQAKKFPSQLLLTATYTPLILSIVGISFDYHLKIDKVCLAEKRFEILQYLKGDQYSFIESIEQRLLALRQSYQEQDTSVKTIVIRINDCVFAQQCEAYFTTMFQASCLFVSSENKFKTEIQEIFEEQMIPTNVEIVFTTSILDEAINLLNPQQEVDSVHIIGKRIHPEDIIQFMGRFRHANVPYFMHCHTNIGYSEHVDIDALHNDLLTKLTEYNSKVNQCAELMAELISDNIFILHDKSSVSIYDRVQKLNTTFEDTMGCKLLWVDERQVKVNYASIWATQHRMDTSYCYNEVNYLHNRLAELYPNIQVFYQSISCEIAPDRIKRFFHNTNLSREEAFRQGVDEVLTVFCKYGDEALQHINTSKKPQTKKSLKLIAQYFRSQTRNKMNYLGFLDCNVIRSIDPNEFISLMIKVVNLAEHIDNLAEIRHILLLDQVDQVIKLGKAYKDNLFVTCLSEHFNQCLSQPNFDFKIDQEQAVKLIVNAFTTAQNRHQIPMGKLIKGGLIRGAKLFGSTLQVKPSIAMNFLVKHFDMTDVNSHKPKKRYLHFKNINKFGYNYIATANFESADRNIVSDSVVILGNRYNNRTGDMLVNAVVISDLADFLAA